MFNMACRRCSQTFGIGLTPQCAARMDGGYEHDFRPISGEKGIEMPRGIAERLKLEKKWLLFWLWDCWSRRRSIIYSCIPVLGSYLRYRHACLKLEEDREAEAQEYYEEQRKKVNAQWAPYTQYIRETCAEVDSMDLPGSRIFEIGGDRKGIPE